MTEKQTTEVWDEHNIWEKPDIKAMREQPVGSFISLTKEEAEEIARWSLEREPTKSKSGMDVVREIRPQVGKALLARVKRLKKPKQ
jgi:hypothetical protein